MKLSILILLTIPGVIPPPPPLGHSMSNVVSCRHWLWNVHGKMILISSIKENIQSLLCKAGEWTDYFEHQIQNINLYFYFAYILQFTISTIITLLHIRNRKVVFKTFSQPISALSCALDEWKSDINPSKNI